MTRSIIALFAATAGFAGTLTETVNCGGAIQNSTTALPASGPLPQLSCNVNGTFASISSPSFVTFELVVHPSPGAPANPPAHAGDLASLSWVGNWIFSFDWTPPQPVPAFYTACITQTFTGGGSGSFTGSAGSFNSGAPCDFAHAAAFPVNNSLPLAINLTAAVHGSGVLDGALAFKLFDAQGNAITQTGLGLIALADTPEPSSALLLLLPLG